MIVKEVSNNIRELRAVRKLSQQQLADIVGCTRQTIISLEKNKYSPSYLLVSKIAKVFDVQINEVVQVVF